tara:strand:- start:1580 stop:1690 length:111 start_codon:yes stop_codon:yes gene_type:complete
MKRDNRKHYIEIAEHVVMYVGFIAIISLIIVNLFST